MVFSLDTTVVMLLLLNRSCEVTRKENISIKSLGGMILFSPIFKFCLY